MTIEFVPEGEDSGESGDTYEPLPHGIADGECLIFDPAEFSTLTKSVCAINRDGALFVLQRDSPKWVNVEALAKAGRLSAVPTSKPKDQR